MSTNDKTSRCIVHYWAGCPQVPNSKWRHFVSLLKRCREDGWRTILVWSAMPGDPALADPFLDSGCEIMLQPKPRRNFDASSVWRTHKLLRSVGCDVLHCHNVHTSPLIGATLARTPVRLWSKLSMSQHYEEQCAPRGLHRLQLATRVSAALSHQILPISQAVGTELQRLRIRESKLEVMSAPIEIQAYRNVRREIVREELGMSDSDMLISTVGQALPVKGWDTLVRAFAKAFKRHPRSRLVLVGSNTAPQEVEMMRCLRQLAHDEGLAGRVIFLGARSDVEHILAASDVFVLPSRSEGQSLALTEALAAGLPCIAARVGGVPELIVHGENGLLFDRESVSGLCDHLDTLLAGARRRRELGQAAARSVGRFDMALSVDRLMDLYGELSGAYRTQSEDMGARLTA